MSRSLSSPRASSRKTRARKAPARSSAAKREPKTVEVPMQDDTSVLNYGTFFQQGLIDPHHKRRLIDAHTHARHARHSPHHHWAMLVGVSFCSALVLVGWWFTVGSWIRGHLNMANRPSFRQEIQHESKRMEEQYQIPSVSFVIP